MEARYAHLQAIEKKRDADAEYERNRDAIALLEQAEQKNKQLAEQISDLKTEILQMDSQHRQEINAKYDSIQQYQKRLADYRKLYAQRIRDNKEQYDLQVQEMQQQFHEQQLQNAQKLTEIQEKLTAAEADVSRLKKILQAAGGMIFDICKAVGMLTDTRGGAYRCRDLSDRQESLIDAVREIGSTFLERLGFRKTAQKLENSVGVSEQIQARIEEKISQRHYERDGMCR